MEPGNNRHLALHLTSFNNPLTKTSDSRRWWTLKAADGWLLPESQSGTTIFTFLSSLDRLHGDLLVTDTAEATRIKATDGGSEQKLETLPSDCALHSKLSSQARIQGRTRRHLTPGQLIGGLAYLILEVGPRLRPFYPPSPLIISSSLKRHPSTAVLNSLRKAVAQHSRATITVLRYIGKVAWKGQQSPEDSSG